MIDYLGDTTMAKVKTTKWWLLARFLDDVLDGGGDVHTEGSTGSEYGYDKIRKPKDGDPDYARKFIVGAQRYVSGSPEHIRFEGRDGDKYDVAKTLRELMHECERMAVKEST